MLKRSPPRLAEGVGKRDVGLREKPFEKPRIYQLVNGTVEVLDATVNEEGWLLVDQLPRGAEQLCMRSIPSAAIAKIADRIGVYRGERKAGALCRHAAKLSI